MRPARIRLQSAAQAADAVLHTDGWALSHGGFPHIGWGEVSMPLQWLQVTMGALFITVCLLSVHILISDRGHRGLQKPLHRYS